MHVTKQYRLIEEIALPNILVVLKEGNWKMVVNALLDDGSTKPYFMEDVAAEMGLKGSAPQLQVNVLIRPRESLETMSV